MLELFNAAERFNLVVVEVKLAHVQKTVIEAINVFNLAIVKLYFLRQLPHKGRILLCFLDKFTQHEVNEMTIKRENKPIILIMATMRESISNPQSVSELGEQRERARS